MKFGYILAWWFKRRSLLGRRTDDRGCLSYKLPWSLWLRGAKTVEEADYQNLKISKFEKAIIL